MLILGFNAYHGDVAAAILRDGQLVAAVEEERLNRVKHAAGFPHLALRECLRLARAEPRDIDVFAVPRAPGAHLWRRAWFALRHTPGPRLFRQYGSAHRRAGSLAQTLSQSLGLEQGHAQARLRFVEHHPAHLASAMFTSGFTDAATVAIDGFGDFVSTSVGRGTASAIDVHQRVFFPHSLGILYLAGTQFLGFRRYGDEYKVMGLAPYGNASRYKSQMSTLLNLQADGRFALRLDHFRHWSDGIDMTWDSGEPAIADVYTPEWEALLGPPRRQDESLDARHADIAAALQAVFEAGYFHILHDAHRRVPQPRLCLAGGCAMNSVANGKILAATPFRDVFIQPAAADNGTALGAALTIWHQHARPTSTWRMEHAYWGADFNHDAIARAVRSTNAAAEARLHQLSGDRALCDATASRLANGAIVGWFQGRMELGARALGNRSILADPRRADMRETLNAKIKLREQFRPFAPSVLEDRLSEYFVDPVPDPFMMRVLSVLPEKRHLLPAVTHVDGTARVQSVNEAVNPLYCALLRAFDRLTGVPVLLNTSFNENEPIVNRPEEAINCFLRTEMDVLVIGAFMLEKRATTR